jgi:general L-amino acid transport system substrate-binding protein
MQYRARLGAQSGAVAAAVFAIFVATAAWGATLDDVRARGTLVCGVSEGLPGFSDKDSTGTWAGFDVDFCRAVAAAIFGDAEKVEYVPLSAAARFDALTAGKIDLLSRNSTWTMARDTGLGIDFAGIAYYDGQAFLSRASYGVHSALELQGARICVLSGTTSEDNAAAYFAGRQVDVTFMPFETREESRKAYEEEACDAMTADRSALAAERSLMAVPDDHVILPEIISKEPLGPVTRDDDPAWTDLVRWTLYGLINAEERGITSASLGSSSPDAAARQAEALALGKLAAASLKLDDDWLANVLAATGNYGEIFDRNLGPDTPLAIDRGINAPWNAGGILYAPPMQ